MTTGSLTLRVRPLRIGFLVNPKEKQALRDAITAATLFWGGAYNPIIPAFGRLPRNWERFKWKLPSPTEVVEGYIEAFDPDIIVPTGTCDVSRFNLGHRESMSLAELMKPNRSPGIGLVEVLDEFVSRELKFQRADNLRLVLPKISARHWHFLAAVAGALPEQIEQQVLQRYEEGVQWHRPDFDISKLSELLEPRNFFARRLTQWNLDFLPGADPQLFLCDATSALDIIDYWNLRASGRSVLPIPLQVCDTPELMKLASGYAREHWVSRDQQPEMFDGATLQFGRSVDESIAEAYQRRLNSAMAVGAKPPPRVVGRHWYPRLWEKWAREAKAEGPYFPYSHEVEVAIHEDTKRLDARAVGPKFENTGGYYGVARFANEVTFRLYGASEPVAEVFPAGSARLSRAIAPTSFRQWRFSQRAIVFLANRDAEPIFLEIPKAEAVMHAWMSDMGWKVELSPAGRMANQLFKQLDGIFGVGLLASKVVLDLLIELDKEGGMPWPAVTQRLKSVRDDERFDPNGFLRRLVEVGAMKLGLAVQCPVCLRRNWLPLNELGYDTTCRLCLSNFELPVYSPSSMRWTYRAHGPFAAGVAQGAFSVLMVLRVLTGRHTRQTTPLFSYAASKDKTKIEADLTCLVGSTYARKPKTELVHAECKSFNGFEGADFDRMEILSRAFPGSHLIFATLKTGLTAGEIRRLRALSLVNRRRQFARQPFSHVIVLTGVELLSALEPPRCWEGKKGAYEAVVANRAFGELDLSVLADLTQQIYLDLPSWSAWSEERANKRRMR